MATHLRLTLPIPPSVNAYWRVFRNRIILSAEARAYKALAAKTALLARVRPIAGDVGVLIRIFRPARRGDTDNYLKATLDALRGVAFLDDRQVRRIEAERFEDKSNPRVEIEVEPLT